jgi:hypothetical protein
MGYVRNRVYRLKFEDPEYEGLEVRARSAPIGRFLDLAGMADAAKASEAKALDDIGELVDGFAQSLVSWNVEDLADPDDDNSERTPVPATLEGLRSQDFEFVFDIVMAWIGAVADVATPLDRLSKGGLPSVAASIPMEPLSESQAS